MNPPGAHKMPKFRKKPIVIEAEQYQAGKRIEGVLIYGIDHQPGLLRWFDEQGRACPSQEGVDAFIPTKEGMMHVSPGDWVITGVQGEIYPCKPDIFEATYEPVG
jgi:hypothetical protein